MARAMLRLVYLLLTLCSMAPLASPESVFEFAGVVPPVSAGIARMAGFAGMFVFFAMFSGASRFGAADDAPRPDTRVEHLLPLVPQEIATMLPEREALLRVIAFSVEGRKIQAIKALRMVARTDLKDAKELVEQLQRALKQARS